jgi:hypothetical protein
MGHRAGKRLPPSTSTIVVSWSSEIMMTWSSTGWRSTATSARSQLATQVILRGIWSWGASGFSKESMLRHPQHKWGWILVEMKAYSTIYWGIFLACPSLSASISAVAVLARGNVAPTAAAGSDCGYASSPVTGSGASSGSVAAYSATS